MQVSLDLYNPERIHFGVLRVLNDDIISPGMRFGVHPHGNMKQACKTFTPRVMINIGSYQDMRVPYDTFENINFNRMKIITIPLEGDLEHKESMGNAAVIREGEIQVMNAGTGFYHSDYNKNSDRDVNYLYSFPSLGLARHA